MKKIAQIFPLLYSLNGYSQKDLWKDFAAALTVWVILVPQGMAYAFLAGLPPIYGLYGGLVPLFLYGLFGSSRQLSIGPVAISALLVLAGVSQLAEPFTEDYISLVIISGLLIGFFQMLLGLIRMGFLVSFLSHPVVSGFTSAAAIIISINQLKDVLGITIPRFRFPFETLVYAVEHLGESNLITLSLAIGAIVFMLVVQRINKVLPVYLMVVILGIGISALLGLDVFGVQIVGKVPEGLPSFHLPEFDLDIFLSLLFSTVLPVTLIGIVESIGIAKGLESKHGDYTLYPNQELIALGISKIGGSFFQAIPTSGSFSRSAVNSDAGARSGISSIITSGLILLSLLFLTPLFYYLPKAILAAIILMAVKGLFDWKEAKYLWRVEKGDFYMMLITFMATLILGIGEGVLTGVLVSIFAVLYKSSRPHIAELGSMPNSTHYRNIHRFNDANIQEEFLIVRMDEQLYFANADYFKQTIHSLIKQREKAPTYLILNFQSMHNIDSTGMHTFSELHKNLTKKGITLILTGVIGPVRDKMYVSGLMEQIGKENFFLYVHHAISYLKDEILEVSPNLDWTVDAIQTDIES